MVKPSMPGDEFGWSESSALLARSMVRGFKKSLKEMGDVPFTKKGAQVSGTSLSVPAPRIHYPRPKGSHLFCNRCWVREDVARGVSKSVQFFSTLQLLDQAPDIFPPAPWELFRWVRQYLFQKVEYLQA